MKTNLEEYGVVMKQCNRHTITLDHFQGYGTQILNMDYVISLLCDYSFHPFCGATDSKGKWSQTKKDCG
ncbi:hypothetical protein BLOT_007897 [Blomia tropicalis]|nr:hypothetical protein BLOT_007897 [Blomia tropicalis]